MYKLGNAWMPTVTDKEIFGFFGEYRWLSNFHVSPCTFEGITYPSSEHAYQAAKTNDEYVRRLFLQLDTPAKAKRFGGHIDIRSDWDVDRILVMYEVLQAKFAEDESLRQMLLGTGDKYLEETNYWGDTFWGICNGIGQNHLGWLLMSLRLNLQG